MHNYLQISNTNKNKPHDNIYVVAYNYSRNSNTLSVLWNLVIRWAVSDFNLWSDVVIWYCINIMHRPWIGYPNIYKINKESLKRIINMTPYWDKQKQGYLECWVTFLIGSCISGLHHSIVLCADVYSYDMHWYKQYQHRHWRDGYMHPYTMLPIWHLMQIINMAWYRH